MIEWHLNVQVNIKISIFLDLNMYNELHGTLTKMQITIQWRLRACFSQ